MRTHTHKQSLRLKIIANSKEEREEEEEEVEEGVE